MKEKDKYGFFTDPPKQWTKAEIKKQILDTMREYPSYHVLKGELVEDERGLGHGDEMMIPACMNEKKMNTIMFTGYNMAIREMKKLLDGKETDSFCS